MLKYFCENCGCQFDEDEIDFIIEDEDRKVECCPQCRVDGYFREMEKCEYCGEYAPELEDGFCEECISETIKEFNNLIDDIFTDEQKEILKYFNYLGEQA